RAVVTACCNPDCHHIQTLAQDNDVEELTTAGDTYLHLLVIHVSPVAYAPVLSRCFGFSTRRRGRDVARHPALECVDALAIFESGQAAGDDLSRSRQAGQS